MARFLKAAVHAVSRRLHPHAPALDFMLFPGFTQNIQWVSVYNYSYNPDVLAFHRGRFNRLLILFSLSGPADLCFSPPERYRIACRLFICSPDPRYTCIRCFRTNGMRSVPALQLHAGILEVAVPEHIGNQFCEFAGIVLHDR